MRDSVSTPPWRAADRQNGSRTRTIAAHLADTGVTDEEELEEVVILASVHDVRRGLEDGGSRSERRADGRRGRGRGVQEEARGRWL